MPDIAMVPIDVGLQCIESALVTCQVTRDAACLPFITACQSSVQPISIACDISTKPVELGVVIPDIAMIFARVLVLIVAIAVVVLSED